MKIAILTQPLGHNYGGLLQAFALQHLLKQLGHECETIDRRKHRPLKRRLKTRVREYLDFVRGKQRLWPSNQLPLTVYKHLNKFRDQHLRMSPTITNSAQLTEYVQTQNFNAIVVGSDQVWRPRYSPELSNFFCDFLPVNSPIKRISFAASFGVDDWEFNQQQTTTSRQLLQYFDAVSVRESSGVELCKKNLNYTDAKWVIDPTLCLKPDVYRQLIGHDNVSEHHVLTYILDHTSTKQALAENVAEHYQMQLHSVKPIVTLQQRNSSNLDDYIFPSIESWLKGFMDAKYVVTDSFHGCVFSILFNKPFVAIGNQARGLSRFKSLLNLFELDSRLLIIEDDTVPRAIKDLLHQEIDWERVNQRREELSKDAISFLERALS